MPVYEIAITLKGHVEADTWFDAMQAANSDLAQALPPNDLPHLKIDGFTPHVVSEVNEPSRADKLYGVLAAFTMQHVMVYAGELDLDDMPALQELIEQGRVVERRDDQDNVYYEARM